MATFLYKTRGNASPKGKPRVYFTCHPEDLSVHLEKLCEDVFKTHDCAIYYTEDMTAPIPKEELDTDLGQMNLFIVPVTFRLLTEPCRAMQTDLAYAKQKHVPILPFMMESGLDALYSLPECFGELQYIDPYNTDLTAIRYEDKLKSYLESVLISDETAKRVRAAFDAYVFLSYRKKDRKYANELMRLIHKNPLCRDIAIWFDEFLTPGESFRENIARAMRDSKLFALLVTPSLLEEVDGKPNFVMGVEYPEAKRAGMNILPAQMVQTDRDALEEKYTDLPACVEAREQKMLDERLSQALAELALRSNDNDPEHNFLIGLAYLDGVDVEVDKERALALITSCAEAGLPEAMKKLYRMYDGGINLPLDYGEALKWARRLAESTAAELGKEHPDTLGALANLALAYRKLGDYRQALPIGEEVYRTRRTLFGDAHKDTLEAANNLAVIHAKLGELARACELQEAVYRACCSTLGEEHPATLITLNNLASTHGALGNYAKACELQERAYSVCCGTVGEKHPNTPIILGNLALFYGNLGEYQKALEATARVCETNREIFGEEHPNTLMSMNNLAKLYCDLGDYRASRELCERVYALQSRILGENHPDTLITLTNLAYVLSETDELERACELQKHVYATYCELFGKAYPYTLTALNNLACTHYRLGAAEEAREAFEELYPRSRTCFGETHPDTLFALSMLSVLHGKTGNLTRSLELKKESYALHCKALGEEHPDTLASLNNLAFAYVQLRDYGVAATLQERLYALREKLSGAEASETQRTLVRLCEIYGHLGDSEKERALVKRLCEIRAATLAEDHPDLLEARAWLARLTEED